MREATERIIEAGGLVYAVGGSVRDEFIAAPPVEEGDRDFLITGLPLPDLCRLLEPLGHLQQVGKSFAVLKFRPLGYQGPAYDLALPVAVREGEPQFDPDLPVEADLARRDFTMNAMARNLGTGELVDPFGGQEDVRERRIRMVSEEVFDHDPLRMVRATQFAARFRFWIEDATFQAIRRRAEKIKEVAPERIFIELTKLLTLSERPSIGFRAMQRLGLLEHVLPEVHALVGVEQPKKFHVHDAFDHTMVCVDAVPSMKLAVRLGALLHDIGKAPTVRYSEKKGRVQFLGHENVGADLARSLLERLKAPKELTQKIERLVRCHMFSGDFHLTPAAVRRLIRKVGDENIHDLIDLRVGDRIASGKANLSMGKVGALRKRVADELAEPAFDRKNLAVDGNDLMAELGLEPGPEIGRLLSLILEEVMDDPSLNNREALLGLARKFLADERVELPTG